MNKMRLVPFVVAAAFLGGCAAVPPAAQISDNMYVMAAPLQKGESVEKTAKDLVVKGEQVCKNKQLAFRTTNSYRGADQMSITFACLDPKYAEATKPLTQNEIRNLQARAQKGELAAQTELFERLADGRGLQKNPQLSVAYLVQAIQNKASKPEQKAAYIAILGQFYQEGFGVKADAKQAVAFYQQAAKAGNPLGLYRLAVATYAGQGGLKANPKKAYQLATQAAQKGNANAIGLMGVFNEQGLGGVKKDVNKAIQLFQAGCKQGDALSCQKIKAYVEAVNKARAQNQAKAQAQAQGRAAK